MKCMYIRKYQGTCLPSIILSLENDGGLEMESGCIRECMRGVHNGIEGHLCQDMCPLLPL